MKTPNDTRFLLGTEELALLVASEWDAQHEKVQNMTMPIVSNQLDLFLWSFKFPAHFLICPSRPHWPQQQLIKCQEQELKPLIQCLVFSKQTQYGK